MHRFIFSSSDSFVGNLSDIKLRNFGIDEVLEISAVKYSSRVHYTSSFNSAYTDFIGLELLNFYGSFTGSLTGSAVHVDGNIIGCGLVTTGSEEC